MNEKGDGAFQFQNAWIEKTRKIREARERYIEERGFYRREMLAPAQRQAMSVTGNFSVPVFCVKYSNTGADPYPVATLQTRLYTGPTRTRTTPATGRATASAGPRRWAS
jgi:hypothetical protein